MNNRIRYGLWTRPIALGALVMAVILGLTILDRQHIGGREVVTLFFVGGFVTVVYYLFQNVLGKTSMLVQDAIQEGVLPDRPKFLPAIGRKELNGMTPPLPTPRASTNSRERNRLRTRHTTMVAADYVETKKRGKVDPYSEYELQMTMWGIKEGRYAAKSHSEELTAVEKEAVRRLYELGMSQNELVRALYGSKGGSQRSDLRVKEALDT